MSARAFSLPIRAFSRPQVAQQAERFTCRRCLHATQTQAEATTTDAPTPSLNPSDNAAAVASANAGGAPSSTYNPALTFSQRDYSLSKTDRLVKRILPHTIRPQLLQNVDPTRLHGREREAVEKMYKHHEIVGVVVRTGRMEKTVTVRVAGRRYEPRIGKYFADHTNHLVHDPNNSLAQGDIVSLHRLRASSAVHHVVASIITPFGTPISSRPPIPTPEERLAAYKASRLAKLHRRTLRREAAKGSPDAIAELKRLGLDPGAGVAAGKGERFGTERGAGKKRTPSEGALMGKKGQKLPEGVLLGGKHEVGKIDERAKHNKEATLKRQRKVEENLNQSHEMKKELDDQGLESDSHFERLREKKY